ncbi:MAG: AraC family transcriptional regulator [Rhodanobacteraceae bacterium]|nr:AraC family transcriptional regulator [Rhodanobacteraceae bacterium]
MKTKRSSNPSPERSGKTVSRNHGDAGQAGFDLAFYRLHAINPPSELFWVMDGVYYFAKSADGRFVSPNKLLQERFGLPRAEDAVGRSDYDFFTKEVAERLRADDLGVMSGRLSLRHKLEVVESPQGPLFWLFTSKAPLRAANGQVVGIEGVSTDAEKVSESLAPYQELKNVLPYIHHHYAADITVAQLANLGCMSVSTLERRFQLHLNCTPKAYITTVRIREACRRLERGQSVKRVALELGFVDQSHMTRVFKQLLGRTPGAFQQAVETTAQSKEHFGPPPEPRRKKR